MLFSWADLALFRALERHKHNKVYAEWNQKQCKKGLAEHQLGGCYFVVWFLVLFFFTSSSEQIGTGQILTPWKFCLEASSAFSRTGVYIWLHFSIYWVWNFLFEICSRFLCVYIVILQNLFIFFNFQVRKWESGFWFNKK